MSLRRARASALPVLLSATMLCAGVPAHAGTMTGAATEWTQILNNISLLQQVIHMIRSVVQLKKQVEQAAQNLKHLGSLDEVDQMLSGLSGIVSSTRGIVFAGESIAANYQKQVSGSGTLSSQWASSHPGRVDPRSLPAAQGNPNGEAVDAAAFRRIDDSVQTAVRKSMATLDVQASEFDSDEQIFTKLKDRIDTLNKDDSKAGQMQALIVGNSLLAEILRQLMKLRQVLIAQANAQGEFQSADAQRRQFADAIADRQYRYTGAYRGKTEFTGASGSPIASRISLGSSGSSSGGVPPATSLVTGGGDVSFPSDLTPFQATSSSPTLNSYQTPDGRTVTLAPGAADASGSSPLSGGSSSLVAGSGDVSFPSDLTAFQATSSSPTLNSYQTPDGRTVTLAPGSATPARSTDETADEADAEWEAAP